MALDTTALDADLNAILADLPETLTFGGTDYTCNRVRLSRRELAMRNREVVDQLRDAVSIQRSDFVTLPAVDDTVTYNGETLRVIDTDDSPDNLERRLYLGDRWQV